MLIVFLFFLLPRKKIFFYVWGNSDVFLCKYIDIITMCNSIDSIVANICNSRDAHAVSWACQGCEHLLRKARFSALHSICTHFEGKKERKN